MTHCTGYRAAVLGRAADVRGIGIDAELHVPMSWRTVERIALPAERRRIRSASAVLPQVHWGKLLFSAKESVYKTWFPLTGRPLRFADVDVAFRVARGCRDTGSFRARFVPSGRVFDGAGSPWLGPGIAGAPAEFAGRWLIRDGLLRTAIVLPQPAHEPGAFTNTQPDGPTDGPCST
ncbi:4'-phosphopantetheinyl transferase Npt [Streptomyces sp. YIM 130001]|nr:4'-phosphopantetheinyl transferase Npt [Streptomyces sp. YIM 130001]